MTTVVLSTLALKGVLDETLAGFERQSGLRYAVQIHATQALLEILRQGDPADLLFMTSEGIDSLGLQRTDLGRSGVGLAVRSGTAKPRIDGLENFKRAICTAQSVAHSRVGASGLYFARLIGELGIKPKKIVVVDKGPVAVAVARGEAELGVQQLSELAPVKGIEIVGPFPDEVQVFTTFSAGVPANCRYASAAQALIAFLRSERAREAMRRNYMEPA
ncbi:MAG: substrate-binding domain-containing protein [Betaproteobacteria bacterium]